MPCLPAVVEDSQEFGLCFGVKMFQHLIGDFVWARGLLVLQGFHGLFNLICVKWAVHVFRWILVSLVVLDFIMYLLPTVVLVS